MPRLAGVVATGAPYHVTQRGNLRRTIFEFAVYLRLLASNCESNSPSIRGFCFSYYLFLAHEVRRIVRVALTLVLGVLWIRT